MPLDGNHTDLLGSVARLYSMYVLYGLRAAADKDDPYAAVDGVKLGYNTNILLGRDGKMIGYYRKQWPCCPAPSGSSDPGQIFQRYFRDILRNIFRDIFRDISKIFQRYFRDISEIFCRFAWMLFG